METKLQTKKFCCFSGLTKFADHTHSLFGVLQQTTHSCICRQARFLAATKQLYEWLILFISPSVTHFSLCLHYRIIMKCLGVITNDQSEVHAKDQGQRSEVKVTEVKTPLNHFRTVTPVSIHIWWWNDAQRLMLLRRYVLLFFKVIHQISRSHSYKIEMTHKAWSSIEEVPYCFWRSSVKFQGHMG